MLKILHTADWQIGRRFASFHGDAAALLRNQRLETVQAIAKLATERGIDAVLVAGDVFEDNQVSDETLRRTMNALQGFEGPWVLLPGNHDAALSESAWTRLEALRAVPANVRLALQATPITLCEGRLQVLPAPLCARQEVMDVTEWFDGAPGGGAALRVGLAHGSVTETLPDQADAHNPIAKDRAASAGLDYLALGDWHGTLQVDARTWYAGTPEPDRFRSKEPGNVLIVTIAEHGAEPVVEPVRVGRYRWLREEKPVFEAEGITALDGWLNSLDEPDSVILRLSLSGELNLGLREELETVLETHRARLHYLDVDDTGIALQPSEDDLADMRAKGFVREAVLSLQEIQQGDDEGMREAATRALRILYREQKALRA